MSNEMIIDSVSFARKNGALQGKIAVEQLTRASEYFTAKDGELTFEIRGRLDQRKRPLLTLTVSGYVTLTCQRCLQAMRHEVDVAQGLRLVKDEAALPRLDEEHDDIDVIVADSKMNVLDLVEDEIILSVPLGPKHDFDCVASDDKVNAQDGKRQPFATLAKFKQ